MDNLQLVINEQHAEVLKDGIKWADKVVLCVAYWRKPAVDKLLKSIGERPSPLREMHILVSLNELITESEALESLLELQTNHGFKVSLCQKKNNIFHPKLYYFEKENNFRVMVGSANMTQAGLGIDGRNEEVSIVHSGTIGSSFHREIDIYLKSHISKLGKKGYKFEVTKDRVDNYKVIYGCDHISKEKRVKNCLTDGCLGKSSCTKGSKSKN